jgi:hypothetical protein
MSRNLPVEQKNLHQVLDDSVRHLAKEYDILYWAIVKYCDLDKKKLNYSAAELSAMLELKRISEKPPLSKKQLAHAEDQAKLASDEE